MMRSCLPLLHNSHFSLSFPLETLLESVSTIVPSTLLVSTLPAQPSPADPGTATADLKSLASFQDRAPLCFPNQPILQL